MKLELSPDDLRPVVEAVVQQTIRQLGSSGLLQPRAGDPSSGPNNVDVLAVPHNRAASMLGISARTLSTWEKKGRIKAAWFGRAKRFRIVDLERLLGEQLGAGPPEGVGGNLTHVPRPPPT